MDEKERENLLFQNSNLHKSLDGLERALAAQREDNDFMCEQLNKVTSERDTIRAKQRADDFQEIQDLEQKLQTMTKNRDDNWKENLARRDVIDMLTKQLIDVRKESYKTREEKRDE